MRDNSIRVAALAVSVVLHAAWLIKGGGALQVTQPVLQPSQSVTRLVFATPKPIPEQLVAKPEPEPEPVVAPEPEPEIKKPVNKPKPKQIAKKQPDPKPEPVETEPPAEPVQMAAAAPVQQAAAPAVDEGMLEKIKQRYLASLMAHIEAHKWYPKSARRRGIQGEVKVSFLLMPDGSIQNMEVKQGPDVLAEAAGKAVIRANPMPVPPSEVDCPLHCEFSMRYALN